MVVIETDSPYLAARKGRNEPSFVGDAIVTISQVWDTEIEEAASIVAENTCRAFNLG
jgi:Tat protein secretion system quality control protein TatD with DNase activity